MNLKVTKEVLLKLRFEKSRHPRLKSFHKKVSSVVNCQSYRVKTLTLLITSNKFEVTNRKFQDKKVVSDVEITVQITEKRWLQLSGINSWTFHRPLHGPLVAVSRTFLFVSEIFSKILNTNFQKDWQKGAKKFEYLGCRNLKKIAAI